MSFLSSELKERKCSAAWRLLTSASSFPSSFVLFQLPSLVNISSHRSSLHHHEVLGISISIKKNSEFDSSGDPHISCFKQGETSYEQAVGRGRLRKSSVCLTTGWSPAATRQYVVFANVFQSEMCKDLKQNRY